MLLRCKKILSLLALAVIVLQWSPESTGTPTSPSPDTPISKQTNCDIPGPALSSQHTKDADQCSGLCQNELRCRSYVFISGWQRCFLKSQNKVTSLTIAAGKKNDDGSITQWDHHDLVGRDMRSARAKDVDECGSICTQDTKCVGFAYLDGYQTCWLKDQLKSGKPYAKTFSCGVTNHP